MRRGDIWWAETPAATGRPYLIVSRDAALPVLNDVLVAPITSRLRELPSTIRLGAAEGPPIDCIANFDSVEPIRSSYFTRRLGALGPERSHEICAAMAAAIDR